MLERILLPCIALLLLTQSAQADLLLPASYSARLISVDAEDDPFLRPVEPGESLELEQMGRRRAMLQWHQGLGLTALGLTTAQVVMGQVVMNYQDAGEWVRADELRQTHRILGFASFGTYAASAALALAAPGIDRDGRSDSVSIHRGLAVIHGLGMVLTPVFGFYAVNQREEGEFDQARTLRRAHQIAGYTTLAAMWGAALVIVLD